MILSSCTPTMMVAAECLGSSLDECRDIYKHVSFTAETDGDYWIFSGQYAMEVELDFNELSLVLTGVVRGELLKENVKMVLKPQGDRLFF